MDDKGLTPEEHAALVAQIERLRQEHRVAAAQEAKAHAARQADKARGSTHAGYHRLRGVLGRWLSAKPNQANQSKNPRICTFFDLNRDFSTGYGPSNTKGNFQGGATDGQCSRSRPSVSPPLVLRTRPAPPRSPRRFDKFSYCMTNLLWFRNGGSLGRRDGASPAGFIFPRPDRLVRNFDGLPNGGWVYNQRWGRRFLIIVKRRSLLVSLRSRGDG
jgi:hypothetical protein